MTTTFDRELPLVELLDAVLDHLDGYELPEPYGVQAHSRAMEGRAQVSVHLLELGLSAVASILMAWADTLSEVSLAVWRPRSSDAVHVQVSGRLAGGVPIQVWAGVETPHLLSSLEPGQKQILRLGLLRTWAMTPADGVPSTADAQAGGAP